MGDTSRGRVSVIIPARNEQATIACVVCSVAKQQSVQEILVIDDQSDDRTGEILDGLKAEISSLRTVRIESLPKGWVGKAHALATGARIACGEWLLFTDADTEHRPGSLAALGLFMVAIIRHWSYRRALRQLGSNPSLVAFLVPGAALLGLLLLNSARAYRPAGRIHWKGRAYATKGKV